MALRTRVEPMRNQLPLILCLIIGLANSGCATNPVTGETDFVLMSEERELELGREYHRQILEQYEVYEDAKLQAYVERIGERLAAKSHRPDIDYSFTVLDSPDVNAFALPGGYIYITRGIMAYFNSEAELAGVLGHELGHVTARHSVQQYSAATASSIVGSILLAGAGAGQAGADLFQTVQLAAIRGYGREHELEADRLGAQYLARAGYEAESMLDVVGILADQEAYETRKAKEEGRQPSAYHGIFATHPENDARLQEVIRAARKYRAPDPRPDARAEYLRRIDGMTFGPGTDQGVVAEHRFLHLDLDAGLSAPAGWTIVNRPQELIFRAPDDAAQLVVELRELDESTAPRALLEERVGGGRLSATAPLEAGPFRGYTGVARQRTSVGQRQVRHAVVVKDGQAWLFAGVSRRAGRLERFEDAFLEIARSLHRLDADERAEARPLRIELVTAGPDTTYAALARQVPARVDDPVARLRLLNGDWPDGEPERGRRVKTLR